MFVIVVAMHEPLGQTAFSAHSLSIWSLTQKSFVQENSKGTIIIYVCTKDCSFLSWPFENFNILFFPYKFHREKLAEDFFPTFLEVDTSTGGLAQ